MEPPRPALTISRSAKRETRNTPVRSTFRSRSQSSTDTEVTDALRTMMPALLTSTSIPPNARFPASRIGPKSTSSPGLPVRRRLRYPTARHPGGLAIPSTQREGRMDPARPLPNPITPEAPPFLDGLRERKLLLPRCPARGHLFFYPRV